MNILAQDIEDFYFWREINSNPEISAAQVNQPIILKRLKELKRDKRRIKNFKNLKIEAKAAVSIKVQGEKRKILFKKNSQKPLPIASLTKLTTALVIFRRKDVYYNLSQNIKISKKAIDQEGDSKWGGLEEGEEISVKNLLYMALIESSNDAAFALTKPLGEKKFVKLMNVSVEKLGLQKTRFFNPTGLEPDDPEMPLNYSTAEDLTVLAQYILNEYPQIFRITANQSQAILRPNGSLHHFIPENTNKLLGRFPGIVGGKTGWSPRAGGCLLLLIKEPESGNYFINVVLGSNNRFGDMEKIIRALGIDKN
jgi:D-alanyl-D-alanine carboxypeptidase